MDYEIIHSGFDGLDLSYRTILPNHALDKLRAAKAEAIKTNSAVAITIGGADLIVIGSGASGGYQYTVDTGPLGATWFFKDGVRSDPWGCRVSIKSLPLALYGIAEMKQRCDALLLALGCLLSAATCRISRVDYAIDLIIPGFILDPDHFVSHSKSVKEDYREMQTIRSSDTITSVRVGKMPNSQVCVYDKRREIISKKKEYWRQIWSQNAGREIDEDLVVWRFELRAGRKAIDSYFNNTAWDMIGHCLGNLLANVSLRIRMVTPGRDSNRSRWADAPLWSDIRNRLRAIPITSPTALNPAEILFKLEQERRSQLISQQFGLEMTIAASLGYTADTYDEYLAQMSSMRRQWAEQFKDDIWGKLDSKTALWKARFS